MDGFYSIEVSGLHTLKHVQFLRLFFRYVLYSFVEKFYWLRLSFISADIDFESKDLRKVQNIIIPFSNYRLTV